MRFIFLLLLLSILASNVFSPQYLIWLAPFVCFLSGLEAGLFISASFMTWFYFRYWDDVVTLQPMAVNLLILRNGLLIVLFLVGMYKLISEKRNNRADRAWGDEETRQSESSLEMVSSKKVSSSRGRRKDLE